MSGQEIDDLISANMATGSGAGSAVFSGAGGGNSTSGPTGGFNPEEAQNDELVRARSSRGTLCLMRAQKTDPMGKRTCRLSNSSPSCASSRRKRTSTSSPR